MKGKFAEAEFVAEAETGYKLPILCYSTVSLVKQSMYLGCPEQLCAIVSGVLELHISFFWIYTVL